MKTITREGIKRIIGPVSGSGGSRGAGGGDISLAGLASEAWVEENYISKAFFNRLFTIHSASGVIDPNDPDEEQTIDSIEALVGFWTEQYVSALGQNSGGGGGGGGGGVTLNQPLEAINNAGLSAPTTAGTMLVWYNGGWTYSPGARLQIGGITATGTVLVNSSVTANSFIKTGGTSNMFLKADGSVDTNTYASETWVSQNYVSIQFFETLFNAINAQGVKVNANSITGIDSIKAMFGLWTERYLSALGQNSGGGGGGGVTLNQPLSSINSAGMNAPTTSGSMLVFNGTTWTYSTAATIVAATATFYGNSHAAGYAVTGKDNTYVVLAGGGTKLLSELGGNTSVSYNGSVYSPSSGIVALGYLTTSVKVNASTYSVNSSGLVDIGSVVTAVKIAGTLTPYSPTAGVVEIPAYPTVPTNVSAFTNDAGYVSTSVSLSDPHLVLASPSGSGGPASFRALVASDIPDLSSIYATSDTLNTAGSTQLGSAKLFLIGASSQAASSVTYSNVNCYIGTDGCLYSNGSKVQTEASGYLPLSGGTLSGDLGVPLARATFESSVPVSGSNLQLTHTDQTSFRAAINATKSYIGSTVGWNDWQNVISCRHRNGYLDGNVYGMYIRTSLTNNTDSLHWDREKGGEWQGERIILDSSNYTSYYVNTLNTAGAVQLGSTKLYLVGAASQGDGVQTYSNVNCYIGTDGCLYSGGSKVQTEASGYVTLAGAQTISGRKTFTGGLDVTAPSIGFGQGIRIKTATDGYGLVGIFNDYTNGSAPASALLFVMNTLNQGNPKYYLGVVSSNTEYDISIPAKTGTMALTSDIVDTKNTAGAGATSGRIWLVGSSAYNVAYSTTYTVNGCYIDSDGCLYSGGSKVQTEASGYVTLAGAQTISGRKTFTGGLDVTAPSIGFGEGIRIKTATDGYGFVGIFDNYTNQTTPTNAFLFVMNLMYASSPKYYIQTISSGNNRLIGIPEKNGTMLVTDATLSITQVNNYVTFTTSNNNVNFDIGSATAIYGKLFQNTSDDRKKNIMNYVDMNLSAITQAPIFNFTWKDYPGTRPSVGTSAQYWEKVLPYSVSEGPDGYLAMDYGATALAAAVLTARKVSEHEQRIAELERENKVLWNMIATLKAS